MKSTSISSKEGVSRRSVLQTTLLGAAGAAMAPALSAGSALAATSPASPVKGFPFDEATISDLQSRMKSGELSAHALTAAYLARIEEVDKSGPRLNSVIEVNPEALAIADALDKERKAKRPARADARNPGADQRQHRHRRSACRRQPDRWR